MLLNIFKRFSHPFQSNYCNWRTKKLGFALLIWRPEIKPKFRNLDSSSFVVVLVLDASVFSAAKRARISRNHLFRVRSGAGSRYLSYLSLKKWTRIRERTQSKAAVLLTRGDLSDTCRDSAALFRTTTPHVASTGQVHEIGKRI